MAMANLATVLLLFVGTIAMGTGIVRWIAKPIESLARARQARTQFMVSDLLVLFAMLQLAVGTVHYLAAAARESGAIQTVQRGTFIADSLTAAMVLFSWWCGVSMVSRAGVNQWWHRAVILAFVVPCGTTSVVAIGFLTILGIPVVIGMPEKMPLIVGIGCAIFTVVGLCGLLTRRIAAKYQPRELTDEQEMKPSST